MEDKLSEYIPSRYKPTNVNFLHNQKLSFQDKIALFATRFFGTMYAVYIVCLFTLIWMIWQLIIIENPFDPYPFAFLLFMASVVQVPLMSLIMVGQNLQEKHARLRAEEEFRTTETIYQDIEKILVHLDKQDRDIKEQKDLLEKIKSQLQK